MEKNLKKSYSFIFKGKGSEYFGVVIVNWLLTIITLGLYYPWAKERTLKYLYSNTYLENSKFHFSGTGKEMFLGFVKVFAVVILLYAALLYASTTQNQTLFSITFFIYFAFVVGIVPFALHGYFKYRMSRSSWRGIRFGYRGDRNTLMKIYFRDFFLTIITFGIYSSWFTVNLRNYILSNIKFGSAEFKSSANGGDYFVLNLKGTLLTFFTFGIYSFWYQRDILRFYFDYLTLNDKEKQAKFKTTISAGDIFELTIVNMLILIFTLGLGYAFTEVRTLNMLTRSMHINGDIDLDEINQTEEEYRNAFGDEAMDAMDLTGII